MRLSPAAMLTQMSLRAGLPGNAWIWMLAADWHRAVGRCVWS